MKTVFATIVIALLFVSTPASAQVDLCKVLDNGGFSQDLDFWTCSHPNNNYDCPLDPGVVAAGGLDGNYVRIDNPGDEDIAGKLVHDAQAVDFPAGTTFIVRLLANRGRIPNPFAPWIKNSPSTLHLGIFGWRAGSEPVIDPDDDNWSRRPNAVSCKFNFTNWAAPGNWGSQSFQCTTNRAVAWLSLTVSGVNHSHSSYIAFDCDTR